MKIFYTLTLQNVVIPCCDWNENITPEEGWHIADIKGSAFEEHGFPKYKEVNGEITPRTQEEIAADIAALPVPEPTELDRLRADIDYIMMMEDL